jgi:hypothetical protein
LQRSSIECAEIDENKPLHNFLRKPGFDRQKVVGDTLAKTFYRSSREKVSGYTALS